MKSLLRALGIGSLVVVVSSLAGGSALAQQIGVPQEVGVPLTAAPAASSSEGAQAPQSWGTGSLSVLNLNAFSFEPFDGAAVPGADGTASRFMVSGNTCFESTIHLPTGAVIDHTELEACDSAAGDIESFLFACSDGSCTGGFTANTSGTPGCGRVASPAGSMVIQNNATTYFSQVCTGTLGAAASFRSLRIFYRLQVSPAPAVATFPNDVPTSHPFFRFIEAMAASGLTGGCAAGSFCPDNPVTRGQLAVFLASALGLHFPN